MTLILGMIPLISFSQNLIEDNFPTKDGLIHYSDVVHVDSTINSNDLYLNAKKWIVDGFKSSKAVIETDDKEAKLIILKSFISKGHNYEVSNPKNWFTLKIEMKDGRYRYSLYDIRYEFDVFVMGQNIHTDKPFEEWMKPSHKEMSERKRKKINSGLNAYCQELNAEYMLVLTSLKSAMSKIENEKW